MGCTSGSVPGLVAVLARPPHFGADGMRKGCCCDQPPYLPTPPPLYNLRKSPTVIRSLCLL